MNKDKIFILILVFWIIVAGGLIGFKQYTLATGTKVILKTLPVDPRDILRGDYIALRYEISEINLNKIKTDIDFNNQYLNNGAKVYIKLKGSILESSEDLQESTSLSRDGIKLNVPASAFKNVRLNYREFISLSSQTNNNSWTLGEVTRKKPKQMHSSNDSDLFIVIRGTVTYFDYQYKTMLVNYGIENYFIQEGTGTNVDNMSGRGLEVEVTVDRFGSAIINKLFLEGKELMFK